MKSRFIAKAVAAVAVLGVTLVVGMLVSSPPVHADEGQSQVQIGFDIAPVHLNLIGKDHDLVGLGSYIVNAVADCNGCHSAGPQTEYLPNGNPYFLGHHPKQVNPATYLGGGNNFGMVSGPPSPNIISRNITPDKSGMPEGHTFAQFLRIIRTGVDLDHAHPNCSAIVTTNCFPTGTGFPPVNGNLLQVMPWPAFQDMNDHDLQAIYEYLSTVPCLEGGPGEPPIRCQ
jgi:hypothetical protein